MLSPLTTNILIDKLNQGFIVTIEHYTPTHVDERPFISNGYQNTTGLRLKDCMTQKSVSILMNDVISFTIHNPENKDDSNRKAEALMDLYRKYDSIFDFLNGHRYYDILFRQTNVVFALSPSHKERLSVLMYLNSIKSENYDDYNKLLQNDSSTLSRFKVFWKGLMMKKYNEVMASLDSEMKIATDQAVKDEINSIKEVIKNVPSDIDSDLLKLNTFNEVVGYWPTLLLPKSDFVGDAIRLKTINASA